MQLNAAVISDGLESNEHDAISQYGRIRGRLPSRQAPGAFAYRELVPKIRTLHQLESYENWGKPMQAWSC